MSSGGHVKPAVAAAGRPGSHEVDVVVCVAIATVPIRVVPALDVVPLHPHALLATCAQLVFIDVLTNPRLRGWFTLRGAFA